MPLAEHLKLGSRWTFVGGKGGVGKTTAAAALGIELAASGEQVTLISTDPAHSLGDALGIPLGPDRSPVPGFEGLDAMEIDPGVERQRFLAIHGTAIAALLERGTYLDSDDIETVTGLTLPGIDEIAALLRLMDLAADPDRRLVVDTAPTGHTLRLLALPGQALEWVEALEAMESKHAAVASALAGRYEMDAVGRFVQGVREELVRAAEMLKNPSQTRFVLVTTAEPVVLAESRRYADDLERLGIAMGGIVVNRRREEGKPMDGELVVTVPELAGPLDGLPGLRRFAAAAAPKWELVPDPLPPAEADAPIAEGAFLPPLHSSLYFVGGKGGVGKSTAAAALAVRLSDAGRRTLLLSVDPAGSQVEVLGSEVGSEAAAVPGAPRLSAQQLDADRSWDDFRRQYEREVEQLFDGLTGGGMSATYDRQVMERLIGLAPPGIDELMALVEVIDTTEDATYDALVVDTAPTGHFLRLLELPSIALEWVHILLRLLLKYRAVTGLGGLAERLLRLSRSLKGFSDLLGDPARTYFLTVALPESLSLPETERLLTSMRVRGLPVGALLVNRAIEGDGVATSAAPMVRELARIGAAAGVKVGVAPRLATGPTGIRDLRGFIEAWRSASVQSSTP